MQVNSISSRNVEQTQQSFGRRQKKDVDSEALRREALEQFAQMDDNSLLK